ncbi:hypothetical protein HBH56_237610 [Parastagonospora nodorum]|nr:hypothetical protein HBH56_237610 [Parastagonospora nodorum]KAH3924341.1 hypothetical protein HBH54_197830 [Parastagonospora nodorum]KAH4024642.1 hypothetical protein HBI09_156620 [Parastagonospora nodorum]KAH4060113.1 hypothetical protein HBH50_222470 [Parastagonospora nodorum]KAH4082814.1 hypothetical protein HBH48_183520 [Parastagonospora nodorum]
MEALVAVGLAGNVVQFVQGAGALIALAKEIRDSGSPKALPQLEELSRTLIGHAAVLQSRLRASTPLTEENQNLLDLATECEQVGNNFIVYLGTFKNSSRSKAVGAVKTAIKYQWSSKKIDDFVDRLDRLRSSLMLAIVLACRTSAEGNNKEILAHLKEIQHDHQARQIHDQIGVVQAAIELLTNAVQNQTNEKIEAIQNEVQLCISKVLFLHREVLTNTEQPILERQILNWIDFRQNHWRYESVDSAYQQTFDWLFETSTTIQGWDCFSTHLRKDVNEPYFINGKAGSGKSTLMKFLHDHAKTKKLLKQWAGSKELVTLHFFFWHLGTDLQRSHAGMLRGILHAMLEKHPELIPAVFPKFYRNWENWNSDITPDYVEVKKAFAVMMEKCSYLKMAIFIDGVDEFEGDYRDMALLLRSLASSRVKLVISSRPLNGCLASLAGCPTLRVQDLTRKDMKVFVDGELSTHHLMTRLVRQFPAKAPQFALDIVEKAEGVFLWVKLVVHLLIQSLENGDTLDEMHALLTTLPSDLRDLYRRMFEKGVEYQKESAVMFQLNEKWLEVSRDQSLPGILMWYAINSPTAALDQPLGPMPSDQYDWGMSSLIKRIQSRCSGLLEIRYKGRTLDGLSEITVAQNGVSIDEIGWLTITYLHRTVHEFITLEDVWRDICDLTKDMSFTISTRLTAACLSTIKLARHSTQLHTGYVVAITQLLREVVDASPAMAHTYLMDLDRTMFKLETKVFSNPGDQSLTNHHMEHWSFTHLGAVDLRLFVALSYVDVYTYAAGEGILCNTMPIPSDMNQLARFAIVGHALTSWMKTGDRFPIPILRHRVRTMTFALEHIMAPEGTLSDLSLWHIGLVVCAKLEHDKRHHEAAQLLLVMLKTSSSPSNLWLLPLDPRHSLGWVWNKVEQSRDPTLTDPDSLLIRLRSALSSSTVREHIGVLEDIHRLTSTKRDKILIEQSLHDSSQINERPSKSLKGGKNSRRSKKMKKRTAASSMGSF